MCSKFIKKHENIRLRNKKIKDYRHYCRQLCRQAEEE